MAQPRTRCALVLIDDDDDRSVELLAGLSHADSYAVAMTVGLAAGARRRTLSMLAKLLRADGYDVDTSIGAEVLGRLAHLPRPDVLLIDVDADHESALSVVRHARLLYASLRIVLVTDRSFELEQTLADLAPSPLILEKPIDYAELCAKLRADPHARTTSAIVALCPESERAPRFGNRG